ncbi:MULTISPECIES: D-2-hydroxyacid dehydrogenase [unclassified Cyanobium]|uniref:D-2-hydroxyacid dehydrogenase n=1 Tax=unclassified Cyanobium TaxID=2627006 RepID=UPI0020CB8AED|nr:MULTISPECIES: D-2-hydroxyacid dehydrogenase [unclassified Cyanobium]MCP9861302.1 D-2-hydroxyacid dehydrogenase [Cyanobium sp. Cruz-8H5]MCP9868542.1 D-2-hydroxyacid dehydrogenase [Cyanobium sp. Cruz-8D1]
MAVPASPAARLVVLDGHTTNPGDLSWEPLQRLGALTVHARTPAELVAGRIASADLVITNKTRLGARELAAAPSLRGICMLSTGHDAVDGAAAAARAIPLCNVPDYGTSSVAQAVFALLLELTNRTGHHSSLVRQGAWSAGSDFCFWEGSLTELAGLTLGVVGLGRIGQAVAAIARSFGMEVVAHRRGSSGGMACDGSVPVVPLTELLERSDVVSLHCPLTPQTRGLIDAARIATMKPGALLINTGRGPLVVEADLAAALTSGRLGGAGLDVLSLEPPDPTNPLLSAPNCVITPHIAWATRAARQRLLDAVAANAAAILAGTPRHVVNGV